MAYVTWNPKTKKLARERILGKRAVDVIFQPGLGTIPEDGRIAVEGPHYPAPHTWYADVKIENGIVTRVK